MTGKRRVLALVVATCALAGCGPKHFSVKGILTVDGKPLANAFVLFNAQDPGGKDASASTDASGQFELSTMQPKDGARAGTYKITVQYSQPVEVPAGLKTAEEVQKAMVQAAKKGSLVLPPMYTQLDKATLTHKVPEDGDFVKLELKSTK